MKNLLIVCLLTLLTNVSNASVRLVVPVYTTHIVERGTYDYNESNPGLGIEYKTHEYSFGYMHAVNSFNKPANYLYASKSMLFKGFSLGILSQTNQGVTFNPDGSVYKYGIVTTPILAYEYKHFRLSTSYPFAKLGAKEDDVETADLVNIQFIYKF